MSEHEKKKIAPIVITVLMVVYFIIYALFLVTMLPNGAGILLGIIPAAIGITLIGVCVQRLREIDGGEEDDLSQY